MTVWAAAFYRGAVIGGASNGAPWPALLGACTSPAGVAVHAVDGTPVALYGAGDETASGAAVAAAPVLVDGDACLLAASVRLDNRAELCAALALCPSAAATCSDADLLLRAYARWKDQCPQRLLGDFAFAIWDRRRELLFAARDCLGVRALYYFDSPAIFACAGNLGALFSLPFVPCRLRAVAIADYLEVGGYGPPGTTIYEDVRVLPSGHSMTVRRGGTTPSRYWTPEALAPLSYRNDADYEADLRERIVQAVCCRVDAGRPTAVHLSGGLDSSAIASVAATKLREQGRRLVALSSILADDYSGVEVDEREYMRAVAAQQGNVDVRWVRAPLNVAPLEAIGQYCETLSDMPFSFVPYIDLALGEAGREAGVEVVLSGFGGDFFASWRGSTAIRELFATGRWFAAAAELAALRREEHRSWLSILREHAIQPLLPPAARRLYRRLRHGNRRRASCTHPWLAARAGASRDRLDPDLADFITTRSPRRQMLQLMKPGRLEHAISQCVRMFDATYSQDVRFPLLDRRVIELMIRVPPEQLQRHGWSRSLFRRALRGVLPEAVRQRRDKGGAFDPAIQSRLAATRGQVEQWAHDRAASACWRYVDRRRLLDALAAVRPARREHWSATTFTIVGRGTNVACFVDWLERSGRCTSL
ncbi:MAG: hypothetical protein HYV63_05620 [Candidatus Schekmanbacteria bacterium]|nr:hypothetical protein [Candidatus Schekmanbacteria bacterium]